MTLSAYWWQLALEFRKREPHVFSTQSRTWRFHKMKDLKIIQHLNVIFPESVWAKGSSNSGSMIYIFTSSHRHIYTYHLHIFASSHLILTYHHRIFASSHLHISSSHLRICTSSQIIFTSSHLILTSSLSLSHSLSLSLSLSLLPSVTVYLLLSSFLS